MIPVIPLIGGLIGALASNPLGTTVARGILGGAVTGVVADVVMNRQRKRAPKVADAPAGPITGGLLLPDGQPVNPPATPGELSERQMVDAYIRQRQGAASEVPGPIIGGLNMGELLAPIIATIQ